MIVYRDRQDRIVKYVIIVIVRRVKTICICVYSNTSYSCTCQRQWLGGNCELYNYCYTNPCINQGVCINNMREYVCFCNHGFMGKSGSIIDNLQLIHVKTKNHVLQNQMDISVIAMPASMWKIVNSIWTNVLLIPSKIGMLMMLVDLHVFGKIPVAKEAYLLVCTYICIFIH